MTGLARQILRLTRLCIAGPGGRIGLLYFVLVLFLGFGGVQVSVRLISWTADFYNALQKLDVAEAIRQIGIFFGLVAISTALVLTASYLRKLLQIRWRRTLTEALLGAWLAEKAYWHLRDRSEDGLDNPDQRIAEDCRIFVEKLTSEAVDVVTNIVALVSYVTILWSLSSFPLAFTVAGHAVEIPRYMVWAAPIYVVLASCVTHWLGRPLIGLNIEQQRREADFRFALTRIREHAEAVALAGGEEAERHLLVGRLGAVVTNWRRVAGRELILGVFTRPYMMTVLRIPLFLALPAFLAGRVTFGGLMQIGSAFQNVVTTLSWFIFSYRDLAELTAASRRLGHFLAAARGAVQGTSAPGVVPSADARLRTSGVALHTPCGRSLAAPPDLVFEPGGIYWLSAPSGHGKSTLVKALAGLWRHGAGRVERPEAGFAFLPQQVYLPLGSLAAALSYPALPDAFSQEDYRGALESVGLARLWTEDDAEWLRLRHALSGGERQRIALARLHLHRPDWIVLDEATSALDGETERMVLAGLRTALPAACFVIVAHRAPEGLAPLRLIDLAAGTVPDAMESDVRPAPRAQTPSPACVTA